MKAKIKGLIVLMLVSLAPACKKGGLMGKQATGVVRWMGDPGAGGCGFLIETSDEWFFPTNLWDEFQEDGMQIVFRYTLEDDPHTCDGESYSTINVKSTREA